jgi:hypothetical protein
MKLIGSKTEQDIRKQLIKSNKSLFENEETNKILIAIREYFPKMNTVYIINWIPEQGEDFYKVLIDNNIIAEIELDKFNSTIKFLNNSVPISQYRIGLSKIQQIKLEVAIDLAKQDMKK